MTDRIEHPDIGFIENTGYGWNDPREEESEENEYDDEQS